MSLLFPKDRNTHRLKGPTGANWLVTRAKSRVEWARISHNGRVHRVTQVIIRWNFYGGTFEKPDVTFVMACGPQRHVIHPTLFPNAWEICARCDNKMSPMPLDRQAKPC